MKNTVKKVVSAFFALAMVVTTIAPITASAAEPVKDSVASTEYYEAMENLNDSKSCDVEATVGSSFVVTIPKKITLGKDANAAKGATGAYKVTVDADLAGTEYIAVVPTAAEGGYKLHEAGGKADVDFVVTQAKQMFIAMGSQSMANDAEQYLSTDAIEGYSLVNLEAARIDGSVAAPEVTAGSWSGVFNFAISLNTKPAFTVADGQ